MEEPIFSIETKMEKCDYRKFLYVVTFCKNRSTVIFLSLISFLGSVFLNLTNKSFMFLPMFISWILLFALSAAVLCLKIEIKVKQRLTTDKAGMFDTVCTLEFYHDKVITKTPKLNSTCTFSYTQFYQLIESKEFFIFYINLNQASILRKKDIKDLNEFKQFLLPKFKNRYKLIF